MMYLALALGALLVAALAAWGWTLVRLSQQAVVQANALAMLVRINEAVNVRVQQRVRHFNATAPQPDNQEAEAMGPQRTIIDEAHEIARELTRKRRPGAAPVRDVPEDRVSTDAPEAPLYEEV